ncbi:MAG TPA: hypothetical protein VIL11_06495, partial [Limnochordales bacterium]
VVRQPAAQVWQEMQEELKSQFRRQIRAIEAQGTTRPQGLASSGWVVVTPRVSPDGRWVAYAAQGAAVEDVRLLELATGRDRQLALARATAPGGLDWTPDGSSVVYSSVERQGAREFADLFRVEVDGGRVRRLTRGLRAYAPAVSPDGARVAFASREGLNTRLMVMGLEDPDRRPPRVVWQPPPGWQILSVAWRPGPYVAVSVWRPGGYTDILLLEPAAPPPGAPGRGSQAAASGAGAAEGQPWREVRWVTADRAVDERPSWSPDGKFLLFHSDRDGIYNLYAWEAGSGRFFRLTNVLTGAFDPVATPDGRSVVFSWYQASGYRLARLGWDQLRWEPVELRQDPDAPDVAAAPAGASSGPAGPPGPGLPAGWKVEPYRPWETLRPQFWVPVSTDDWAGPQLGVQTGGQDVLGEHQYALEAAAGLLSGEPRLYAGYLFSAREGAGPYLLVEGLTRPVARGDGWWRLRQGRLAAAVSWGSNYRSYALQLAASSRDEEPLVDSLGHPLSAPAVRLQLVEGLVGRASLAGDHRAAWLSRAQLTVGTVRNYNGVFNPPLPWGYVLARSDLNRFGPGRPGWRLEVAAGLLGPDLAKAGLDDQGFAFDPGVPGPFQVRAFGRNELPAARAAAAAVRWEWAWRWRTLLRGMGDAPVFGRSVDGALFAEAVAGWNWDSSQRLTPPPWPGGQVASAVGLEVRLNLDLYYGGAPLSLRLGVARALSPYPVARIYFTIASR